MRIKKLIMLVDLSHRYSNESERDDYNMYDDFELKNPLVSIVYTK